MRKEDTQPAFTVTPLPLAQLLQSCHAASVAGGWWHDLHTGKKLDRNSGELRMLIVSELAEAMEGLRKDLMDDKLPHRKMEEVELADFVIRLCDFITGKEEWFSIARYEAALPEHPLTQPQNNAEVLYNILEFFVRHNYEKALALTTIYAAGRGYDLPATIAEKMAFNAQREDHKPENRAKANGKKF